MLLRELIDGLGVALADRAQESARICDVTEDSRTVLPGSLFIARAGARSDGRAFIEQAIGSGAAAILTEHSTPRPSGAGEVAWLTAPDVPLATALLAERFFGLPASKLSLYGVTGTNGKTTVSYLVYQLLRAAGVESGLIGTVFIDDGGGLSAAAMTTPPALELSHCLSRMVENGYRAAALEVSSHALDQRRADALRFDAAIFTNISGDHLDYHGTMDRYIAAKARLFELVKPAGVAVVNIDDPHAERMASACRGRVVRCTMQPDRRADCSVRVRRMGVAGIEAEFLGPWGRFEAAIPLIGAHNAMNALQAVAAAHATGIEPARLESRLSRLVSPPGRLELVTRDWMPAKALAGALAPAEPFSVFVDYAHSDDSLEKALAALRLLLPRGGAKLRVVFGCGGDRDRTKRPRMGRAAVRAADAVIVTSDNPRTENPSAIIREILAGVPPELMHKVHVDADRRAAIDRAIDEAQPGDIVLIAGKGHEDYQLVPDGAGGVRRLSFDDRVAAREALKRRADAAIQPALKPSLAAEGTPR